MKALCTATFTYFHKPTKLTLIAAGILALTSGCAAEEVPADAEPDAAEEPVDRVLLVAVGVLRPPNDNFVSRWRCMLAKLQLHTMRTELNSFFSGTVCLCPSDCSETLFSFPHQMSY